MCPTIDEWIHKMWYTHTHARARAHTHTHTRVEYYSVVKKKWNLAICNHMDKLRGYYAKWNKSDREKQKLYDFPHTWNLKKQNEQT